MTGTRSPVEDGLVVNELQRMMLVDNPRLLPSIDLDSFCTLTLARSPEDNTGSASIRSVARVVYPLSELGFPATVGITYATLADIKGGIFTAIGVKAYEEPYVNT